MEGTTLIIILVAASLVMNLITLILVVVFMKKNKSSSITLEQTAAVKQANFSSESGVVFCRNCGNQYDSTMTVCPYCKTER